MRPRNKIMNIAISSQADLASSYQALRRGLLAFLRRRVSDAATAEDLLQDVFLKALASERRGVAAATPSAWLYAIARNTVVDHYRGRHSLEELPQAELLAADPVESDEDIATQTLAACLPVLIERMAPLYRDTLIAAELEGRPLQALANEWQVSVSAVKSRASRGRLLLRKSMLARCKAELADCGVLPDGLLLKQQRSGCQSPTCCPAFA
jgi:RNA polymerase sigma-70 factor (ECF subfamily)